MTEIKDPENQGRIKATLEWLEEDGDEFETGWLTRVVPWAGPTKMNRGRVFCFNGPLPEVGSIVLVGFINGNPYDGVWLGQPMYLENDTGAPMSAKDKREDWSLRVSLQNGFEFGVDTEGNAFMVVPGNLRVKVLCAAHVSARGPLTVISAKLRAVALSVLRLCGVTIDQTNYPRPDEQAQLREMMIDAMRGEPAREDVGIGKVQRLK